MQTATVTPKYVNPPAAGKKQGNIKLEDGTIYGVKPEMLHLFTAGQTYNVAYESRVWQGKTFHTIATATPAHGGGGAGGAAAAPAKSGGTQRYGATDDATAERIFVQGILQAFIRAGKIEPTAAAVTGAVKALRVSWGETFGKSKTVHETDMSDEIPF